MAWKQRNIFCFKVSRSPKIPISEVKKKLSFEMQQENWLRNLENLTMPGVAFKYLKVNVCLSTILEKHGEWAFSPALP